MTESEKVLSAIEKDDLASAQVALQKALRSDSEASLAELGEDLQQLGFLEESKEVFTYLAKSYPENDGYFLPLAEIAIENDEIELAFEELEKIPKTSENYLDALLVTADLYQLLSIPEVSEAKLKEARTIAPNEVLIAYALGELYLSTDQYQQALNEFEQVKEKNTNPNLSKDLLDEKIGYSLSMLGEFEAAVPFLEQAVTVKETDERLFHIALVLLQLKENEQAIYYLQKLRTLNPQYQAVYLQLAQVLQEEEQIDEAQLVIEEGIHENPYQVELYYFASENAYRLHDTKKAETFLTDALEIGERTDDTLLLLSNLYVEEGFYEEALAAIDQMENQDQPFALWNRAKAYNELEEFVDAAKYYALANDHLHHEIDFMKEYGLFLREEGRLDEAKGLLTHYLAHEPGDLEIQSILDDLSER